MLNSGSAGNGYVIQNEDEALILDCGEQYKKAMKSVDYNVSKIRGAVVSHVHGDHAKYVSDYEKNGIDVFKPYEGGRQEIKFGGFKICAFPVPHDGAECRGFLIHHRDIGYLLYLTDLEFCKYVFKKYSPATILVEANYDERFVDLEKENSSHVLKGHMSLDNCIEFLKANNTDSLKNVILCHLSKTNADPKYFISEVEKNVKCPVNVAERGLEIELEYK